MAQLSPIIQNGILTYLQDGSPVQIVVDSSDWYAWLQTASTFTFRSENGRFTAHKERAGNRRGRAYWRAYRTWHGKLHRAYLGQSEDLTLEHLQSVAVVLASKEEEKNSHSAPGQEGGTTRLSETSSRTRTYPRRTTEGPWPHEAELSKPRLSSFPVPLTALIGREQEVRAICDLLMHPEVRLLTITGTGGVGKTRLALEVARILRSDFTDGACFVPLAPISDPARVMAAIAQALGLWEVADLPPEEQVQAALRERHLLLMLDNFEHLLEAASRLVPLLTSCPRLRILVTSRTILHLSGEHEFVVAPLALPDLMRLPETQTLAQLPAVRLFVERAQALQPAFQLTEANARTLAEISVRLDGLPLAIELAAARIKLLPPQALLTRLARRLEVLTGGAQDLPTRQQTLRNTLQWSYDRLTEQERHLFRWLSIFAGGCTLEAAEAVCRADQEENQASSVLEGIASLLDKSLVQQIEHEGGEPRLVMLETLREFGLECLERQGELEAVRRAHIDYYLQFSEQAEPHLLGPQQLLWFDRLERELDNLRVIFQEARIKGEEKVELALRLASALGNFWVGRGYLREGRSTLERYLARAQAISASIRLKALCAVGVILWTQNDTRELALVSDEALALAQEQGDLMYLARAKVLRGVALMNGRDYVQAQVCLEEALTEARTTGDHLAIALALNNLSGLATFQRDLSRAIARSEECLGVCKTMGEKVLMGVALLGLASAELSQGHTARARPLLEEVLIIYRALGNGWASALVLSLLGQLAFQQREIAQAEAFLAECAQLASELGDRRLVAQSRLLLATMAVREGDHIPARLLYEEGLAIALDLGNSDLIACGLQGLGWLAASEGHALWAAVLWGAAEPLGEPRSVALPSEIYDPMVTMVCTQLGKAAFEEALAKGRALPPAQAFASYQFLPRGTQEIQRPPVPLPSPPHPPAYSAGLTAREVEVLRLVAQGLTNFQVAEQLVISPRTVNWHLTTIYSKLGVNSRAAATRLATEHRLA